VLAKKQKKNTDMLLLAAVLSHFLIRKIFPDSLTNDSYIFILSKKKRGIGCSTKNLNLQDL